jgi:hypothetical protein
MFEKYTFLREDANSLMSTNNSFSSSRIYDTADISLFCKKFSALLLEIGCVSDFEILNKKNFAFLN